MIQFKTIATMILLMVCTSYGVKVSTKGTVTDSSGNGIKGALVRFEICPLNATTTDDGSFAINGDYTSIRNNGTAIARKPMFIKYSGSRPYLHLSAPSRLSVVVFDIQGRQIYRDEVASPVENYFFNLDRIVDGFYIIRINFGGNAIFAKVNKTGAQYAFSFQNTGTRLHPSASREASVKSRLRMFLLSRKRGISITGRILLLRTQPVLHYD